MNKAASEVADGAVPRTGGLRTLPRPAFVASRLVRNLTWLMVAEGLARGLIVAVALAISRVLGPAALGQFVFAQAFIAYFTVVVDAGLTTLVLREVVRRPERLSRYVVSATATQVAISLVLLGVVALATALLPLPRGTGRVVLAMSPLLLSQALNVLYGLQANERMRAVAAVKLTREILTTALALTLLLATRNLVWVAVATWSGFIVGDALCAALLVRAGQLRRSRVEPDLVRDLLRRGMPFLGSALLVQLIINLDVVVLGFVRGNREAGVYSAAYRLAFYALMVAGVVTTTVFPQLVSRWERDRASFAALLRRLVRLSTRISLPAAVFAAVEAPAIIRFLYGSDFHQSAAVLRAVVALPVLGYYNTLVGQALLAAGRQHLYLLVAGAAAVLTAVTLAVLVPAHGMAGAAASVVVAEVSTMAWFSMAARRVLGVDTVSAFLAELPGAVPIGMVIVGVHLLLGPPLWLAAGVAVLAWLGREGLLGGGRRRRSPAGQAA